MGFSYKGGFHGTLRTTLDPPLPNDDNAYGSTRTWHDHL